MATVSILGSKGGSGASLVATNLGVALASEASCLLVDLHVGLGYNDLLLNLQPEHSWRDLLPVIHELLPGQADLASVAHPSGLRLLAAPDSFGISWDPELVVELVRNLGSLYRWLVVDLPTVPGGWVEGVLGISDAILLVAMADPAALRGAKRRLESMAEDVRSRVGLVLNQVTRRHPVHPSALAKSLGVPLLAVLGTDRRHVGINVGFGQPCVWDSRSWFGEGTQRLARRLTEARRKKEQHEIVVAQGKGSEQYPVNGRDSRGG